jgi:hypothetical protein
MRRFALFWCLILGLSGGLRAEQLPEMRPALIGSGPRSLVNMINTERLMKRAQKDAMIMFTCGVTNTGQGTEMVVYRGTLGSDALTDEALNAVTNVRFTPAIYAHQRRDTWVDGTILYRVIDGKPHLRIYLNQESDRILHGDDFIAPQRVFIPDRDLESRRLHPYPRPGYSANVVIRISVDATGKLHDAQLVFETPQGKGFGAQYLSYMRECTFLPGYLNGKPIACSANIEIISKSRAKHLSHWQPD